MKYWNSEEIAINILRNDARFPGGRQVPARIIPQAGSAENVLSGVTAEEIYKKSELGFTVRTNNIDQ